MAKRDMIDDLVDIVHPMPDPLPDDADENEEAGHDAWRDEVQDQRAAFEENIRDTQDNVDFYYDPLLAEITRARREMREAEERMRLLLAYAREFVAPQPYQLKDLAAATGMSISGTRSAYAVAEIADVAQRLARQPRPRPTPATTPPDPATDHTD
ncbi:MAG: hypothetical protein ACRDRH_20640 [Pseudonocardia sp.]